MKIAVIGAGNVGRTLGFKLAAKGHDVVFGVRDIHDTKHAALGGTSGCVLATPADAARTADVILMATPWAATKQAIEGLGPLSGKVLVDCTNPIKPDFSGLEVGHETSGGEMVAGWANGAKVVKCFNQTGFNNMAAPDYDGQKTVMFAAGDDAEAVKTVAGLARDVGFDACALKGLAMSRQLEQLAWLWIDMAMKQGFGREIGFALLKR